MFIKRQPLINELQKKQISARLQMYSSRMGADFIAGQIRLRMCFEIIELINEQKSEQALTYASWRIDLKHNTAICGRCGHCSTHLTDYCPSCGSYMV